MGLRTRGRSIGLLLILVAMATQGITPDAQSLSSPWLVRQVLRQLVPRNALSFGRSGHRLARKAAPSSRPDRIRNDRRDRVPAEVCTRPNRSSGILTRSREVDPHPAPSILLTAFFGFSSHSLVHSACAAYSATRDRQFLHVLCRLTC